MDEEDFVIEPDDAPASETPTVASQGRRSVTRKPLIPNVSRDDSPVGWGESDAAKSDDEYFEDRPPHW